MKTTQCGCLKLERRHAIITTTHTRSVSRSLVIIRLQRRWSSFWPRSKTTLGSTQRPTLWPLRTLRISGILRSTTLCTFSVRFWPVSPSQLYKKRMRYTEALRLVRWSRTCPWVKSRPASQWATTTCLALWKTSNKSSKNPDPKSLPIWRTHSEKASNNSSSKSDDQFKTNSSSSNQLKVVLNSHSW